MNDNRLKRAVMDFIQPMKIGAIMLVDGLKLRMNKLQGQGEKEATHTSPYGFVSHPVKGVGAYFQNLAGDILAPVVIAHLDKHRPSTQEGESIMYSRNGKTFPVKITCKPDGTLEVITSAKVVIKSPDVKVDSPKIELGEDSLEKIVNGEAFQNLFNGHRHLGNAGVPTEPPMPDHQMKSEHLSNTVKAQI